MNLTELIRLHNHLEELTMQDLQYESSNRFELIIDRVDVPQAGVDSGFQQRLKEKIMHYNQYLSALTKN